MAEGSHRIYTLWASLPEDPGPWMLEARDEYAYEGNPDACDAAFEKAKALCVANGWVWREVTLLTSYSTIAASFEAVEIPAGADTRKETTP